MDSRVRSAASVCVVIPTFNRRDSLQRTLHSLAVQTLAVDRFEVIVVDDGSTDDTAQVANMAFPFALHVVYQPNLGAAQARNTGAQHTRAPYLVFVDDDIVLEPDCLEAYLDSLAAHPRSVVVGTLKSAVAEPRDPFYLLHKRVLPTGGPILDGDRLEYTACTSGFMAMRREDYSALGMMHGLDARGANAWCDVEFGYRAHRQGYTFYGSQRARGYHHDYALQSFSVFLGRCKSVGRLGAQLLQQHPDLRATVHTLRDKEPISWADDPLALVLRKVLRALASSGPSVAMMERLVPVIERRAPQSQALVLLYRWLISAALYRGYRQGLRELREMQ